MKVAILHTRDAQDPADPVLAQVRGALQHRGHDVRLLVVDTSIDVLVRELTSNRPDLIFNLAESYGGKSALESNVAGLLNLLDLRYTGSSPAGLLLAGDKALCKKVLGFHEIRTPEFATLFRGAVEWADRLHFPLIVKPPQEDASIGISRKSIVTDVKELLERMGELQAEFQQPVLVEEFIEGREFYVGVLGNANARALPPIELDFSRFPSDRPRIASWEAKWGEEGDDKGAEYEGTVSIFPDDLTEELDAKLRRVALDAYHALRLRDYGRIDLRVGTDGEPYVLEVNPNCYLEAGSEFARAAQRDGMGYETLIATIAELALARYAR